MIQSFDHREQWTNSQERKASFLEKRKKFKKNHENICGYFSRLVLENASFITMRRRGAEKGL